MASILALKGCPGLVDHYSDPEIRRLLYNAAMAASRTERWKKIYLGYLARGLKKTEALTILARKLARIAFVIMQTQTAYQPQEAKSSLT